MVNVIASEMNDRHGYIHDTVRTIYFGGGTPSLLTADQIKFLIDRVYGLFHVLEDVEITLEANPEDLSVEYAKAIKQAGVNRLSIGIQTFNEERLHWMNRVHSLSQGMEASGNARVAGFDNVSLDLIYALPNHSQTDWERDLEMIVKLDSKHISLYGLTIENRTVFGKWERDNVLIQIPEDEAAQQYLFAIDYLKEFGYIQYEVSSFGKDGFYSKHNNNYWNSIPYLGVGPGAHSFNGTSRRFNVRNNSKYIKARESDLTYWEEEFLSKIQLINEKILTQLRITRGLNLNELNQQLEVSLEELHRGFLNEIQNRGLIRVANGFLTLTSKGFLVADEIALKLFFSE